MSKKKVSLTINEKLINEAENLVDGIKIKNRSQAVEYLMKKALGDKKKGVILCGGPEEETYIDGKLRFAKEVDGDPAIIKNIRKLKKEGFSKVWIVGRDQVITDLFGILKNGEEYGVEIQYIEEKESRGTASSLKLLKGKINSTFLVLYGDIVTDMSFEKLWNAHLQNSGSATLMLTTSPEPGEKGVVDLEGNRVVDFKQKPHESDSYVVFSSALVTEPVIFEYKGNSLEEDVFPKLVEKKVLNGHMSSGSRTHIGKSKIK